ncbi:DUF4175 family protein [Ignavibacterium sp.]|uniref:DUF4175 family protein n=1 Tax=Ignavibacterium sp. TaxID=2651167 RepID=UPI002209A463|nr:DUF4175 family protein [Ignavibacterium sp.]BDQ03888.1 MAG: hypothetical protein KatS3mg037_2463 [Ignavibacterium sp.]
MSESQSKYYSEIISKLEKLVRKNFSLITAKGLLISLSIIIAALFLFILAESLFRFSASIRTILFYSWVVIIISSLAYFVFIPILKLFNIIPSRNYFETAKIAGLHFPFVKDELLNSLQLVNGTSTINLYSVELIDAAFSNVYQKVKDIDFSEIISFNSLKKHFTNFIVIAAVVLFSVLLISPIATASGRFFSYGKKFIPPAEFQFEVFPGNTKITKGENVEVKIKVTGKDPGEIFLAEKDVTETGFTNHKLERDSVGVYSYKFQNIRNTTDYFAFAKEIRSEEYKIEVTDHPVIKLLEVKIIPPAYSKLPVTEQKDNGNITALKGSIVEYKLIASKEVKSSKIVFSDSSEVLLTSNNNQASGSIRISGDKNYQIIITDLNNDNNLQPVTYSIKALEDAYPSIELNFPRTDINLPEDNRVPINLKVSDDFGFTKLVLNYRLSSSQYEKPQENFSQIEIQFDKNIKEQFVDYIWNLTKLSPAVNDVFTFYLEIFDNDNISGPKSAKTQTINLRVPSLDEILAQVDKTQDDALKELQETIKEAQELKKDIEQINRDLKQDKKELTWEEKQKIEKALDKFESLQEKMQSISEKLKDVQNELQQNKLLSKETLEKYMQLQELMEEMTSDELKKTLEQMRQTLEQLNRNMTQDQMKNMQIDEEKFRKSIERTMNLLKRIQIEQKIDEMLKRTERMNEKQEELSKQTEKSNPNDQKENENLSKQQDEISKELQNLENTMEDLKEKMQDMSDVPKEELDKLMEEFDKQQNEQLSKQASQNLKQGQKQNAQKNQKQLSNNMQQMQQMMQQMKDQMMQQNQMQTFTDMMRIIDNLLSLSKKQEELKNQSQKLDPNSSQYQTLAQQQNEIKNNLNKLLEQLAQLSQKTFAVTPEMGKALGLANKNMEQSLSNMQNRNPKNSAMFQQEAMGNMNQAIMMMKSQLESMMQGGSGQGGMMSLLQQLQQLSGQQMTLNNMTQMLQQMQQGNLNQEQQAQLQRLAQQQQLIQKSLEQLNKEAKESGESKKIPANLENIAKQMQEVITDMQTEKLTDDLIQKQERILSKLLDAQRSINERDFEQERKSETGKNIVRQSPSELNLLKQKKDFLKDEIDKAIREGYSKDYEELIRKYFELIQQEVKPN